MKVHKPGKRLKLTAKEFYRSNPPSEYLKVINELKQGFISYANSECMEKRHLQNMLFAADNIGTFIVQLKEDLDLLTEKPYSDA